MNRPYRHLPFSRTALALSLSLFTLLGCQKASLNSTKENQRPGRGIHGASPYGTTAGYPPGYVPGPGGQLVPAQTLQQQLIPNPGGAHVIGVPPGVSAPPHIHPVGSIRPNGVPVVVGVLPPGQGAAGQGVVGQGALPRHQQMAGLEPRPSHQLQPGFGADTVSGHHGATASGSGSLGITGQQVTYPPIVTLPQGGTKVRFADGTEAVIPSNPNGTQGPIVVGQPGGTLAYQPTALRLDASGTSVSPDFQNEPFKEIFLPTSNLQKLLSCCGALGCGAPARVDVVAPAEPIAATPVQAPAAPPEPCANGVQESGDCKPILKELTSDTVVQPLAPNKKVNFLFLIDTSTSLRDDYAAIAENLPYATSQFPPDTEFKFAVMLGHGRGARIHNKDYFGKLYDAGDSDNTVLSANRIFQAIPNNAPPGARTSADVSIWLEKKFKGIGNITNGQQSISTWIPRDPTDAQGEALLANLQQFFDENLDLSNREFGFPDFEAALFVVIISDENDVCFDYSAANRTRKSANLPELQPMAQSASKKSDSTGVLRDPPESRAFDGDICSIPGKSKKYSHETVYNAIQEKVSKWQFANNFNSGKSPVQVTGVVFNPADKIKRNVPFGGDNEVGHGYLELINSFGMTPESLVNPKIGDIMAGLGSSLTTSIKGTNVLPLQVKETAIDLSTVVIASIQVVNLSKNSVVVTANDLLFLKQQTTTSSTGVGTAANPAEPRTLSEPKEPTYGSIVIPTAKLQDLFSSGKIEPGDHLAIQFRAMSKQ